MNKILATLILAGPLTMSLNLVRAEEISTIIDNIRAANQEIANSKANLRILNDKADEINRRVENFNIRVGQHRAQPCHWVGNPSQCDWYRQRDRAFLNEGEKLEAERDKVSNSIRASEQQLQYYRSRISIQFGLLRAASSLGCLQEFRDEAVICSGLEREAAAACMIKLWEDHCALR